MCYTHTSDNSQLYNIDVNRQGFYTVLYFLIVFNVLDETKRFTINDY